MKAFPWILAGIGAGAATYFLLRQQNGPQFAASTGYDSVNDAANRTATWGDKQRAAGLGSNLAGKVKEGFGRITGNDDLAAQGTVDQAAGSLRDAAGTVANAAGQALKDLNF